MWMRCVGIAKRPKVLKRRYRRNGVRKLVTRGRWCVRRKDETSEGKWLKCLDRKWRRRLPFSEVENVKLEHELASSATFYWIRSCCGRSWDTDIGDA